MPKISFDIDDELKKELIHLQEESGLDVNHLFRETLTRVVEEYRTGSILGDQLLDLTLKDRLTLNLLFKILEKVDDDDAYGYRVHQTTLQKGYEAQYPSLVARFNRDGVSVEISREVLQILHLHQALRAASAKHGKKSDTLEGEVDFRGFDEQNEPQHYWFALYFLQTLGRFQDLHLENDDCNSRKPMLPRYRAMLGAWKEAADHSLLSRSDLRRIIDAGS